MLMSSSSMITSIAQVGLGEGRRDPMLLRYTTVETNSSSAELPASRRPSLTPRGTTQRATMSTTYGTVASLETWVTRQTESLPPIDACWRLMQDSLKPTQIIPATETTNSFVFTLHMVNVRKEWIVDSSIASHSLKMTADAMRCMTASVDLGIVSIRTI